MSEDDLVVLSTFTNHIEADLARSALDAMGIESMVRASDAELAKMVISGSASGT